MNWQDKWEAEAAKVSTYFDSLSAEELVALVTTKQWDAYYSLWYAVLRKCTLENAAWPLYDVIAGDNDMLYRYHASAALWKLLKLPDEDELQRRVQFDFKPEVKAQALNELQLLLTERIGDRV